MIKVLKKIRDYVVIKWQRFLDLIYVSDFEKSVRLSICNDCNHYIHETKQCGICKCIMPMKTKFRHSSCPQLKWF